MPNQPGFFDDDRYSRRHGASPRGRRRDCDRLILMALLAPDPARAAARIGREHQADRRMGSSRILEHRTHVSLLMLDERYDLAPGAPYPKAWVEHGRAVGDAVTVAPFRATFDWAQSFSSRGGRTPYVLVGDGNEGFHEAFREVCVAMMGRTPPKASYTPHVTLLYGEARPSMRVPPVSWVVRDFVLVHSLVGQSIYRTLQRWRLQEGGAVRVPTLH